MAASHVQHKLTRGGGASTIAATFDSNVTAGNAIAVFIRWGATTLSLNSVTDGLSNSYTIVHNPTLGGVFECALAYATGITGGACTVTATFSGNTSEADIIVHESTGTTLAFDASDATAESDLGTGTDAWSPQTAATFTAGAIVNAFACDEGYSSTWTAGTGYTGRINVSEVASETQVFAAGGSLAAKFTNDNGFIDAFTGILAFKEGAGGGRTTKNTRAFPLGTEIGMGWVLPSQV